MGIARLTIPTGSDRDEWLRGYADWFAHFRKMQPADLGWRENQRSDRWAHEMVAATLLPGWMRAVGDDATSRFADLKNAFRLQSRGEQSESSTR